MRFTQPSTRKGIAVDTFKPGDRVRLVEEASGGVQPGVAPGAEGTVLDDLGQRPWRVLGEEPVERLYVVLFDDFKKPDLAFESALEAA